jgi:carbonic anhydrase/acetyltransferase-like protein (isoleucine patch superfamily)
MSSTERSALVLTVNGSTPHIDDDAWLAPTATVIGAVVLAAGASVFYGAVLRADGDRIEIGADSNLQDNVVVHVDPGRPTVVGSGVSVGHNAVLHGCTVEDDCLIGMNATVLNGAVIGAGSLVAAGTVVLEGTVVPPGSLVAGVPGRVRRELDDEERAGIRRNAETYRGHVSSHSAAVQEGGI